MSAHHALARQARRVLGDEVAAVPSPCISLCRMDADNRYCQGCLRTLDEIASWSTLGEDARREVWTQIGQRIAQAGERA
ncbi:MULTISPECIES: DUF1289 domain-containing protein [Ramlibacter]|uniref:DUF1289 domain-containing protein n=1 Tax=Ramlibacter aquaticus TaxID=2780094 RepID=A0ABR9SA55_9BURK|nr:MULTISPECIES: DUF1289 domain-containing protein [Ramlibacter]MBE7939166.1 DUF1289 domain-containing protein [Ramlibacter aquaticus]